jgi:hypothetical protein
MLAMLCAGRGAARGLVDDGEALGVPARPRRPVPHELGVGIGPDIRQPAPLEQARERAAECRVVATRRPQVPAPPGLVKAGVTRMLWVHQHGRAPVRVLVDLPASGRRHRAARQLAPGEVVNALPRNLRQPRFHETAESAVSDLPR